MPTVTKEKLRGSVRWVVNWTDGTERRRKYCPSQRAAEAEATRLRGLERQAGTEWAALSDDERETLAGLWSRAKRAGVDLVRLFDERPTSTAQSVTLEAAVAQLIEAKRASGCRPAYVTNLRQCLEAFANGREAQSVATVTAADVEEWLKLKGGTAHTRAMWRSRLSTLFGWCVRRQFAERNPVSQVDAVRIDYQPPQILTVDECKKLLGIVRKEYPAMLAWVALGLFAGIRPSEVDRLKWSDIRGDTVTIDAAASKVRARRIVSLEPVAVAWVTTARNASGPHPDTAAVSPPHATRRRALRKIRETMGWDEWPADILRHTAASYLLAHHQDAGKVALNLGNSPGILLRHYRQLVTREDAARWLALGAAATGSEPLRPVVEAVVPNPL